MTLRCAKQRQPHYPGHVSLKRTTSPLAHTLTATAIDDADSGIDQVAACMDTLDALAVPATAGRERAREALRGVGWRGSNDTLGEAIKLRKTCPSVSGQVYQNRWSGLSHHHRPL